MSRTSTGYSLTARGLCGQDVTKFVGKMGFDLALSGQTDVLASATPAAAARSATTPPTRAQCASGPAPSTSAPPRS